LKKGGEKIVAPDSPKGRGFNADWGRSKLRRRKDIGLFPSVERKGREV